MTTKRFQVCFTGDIEIGFTVDEVKKNLAVLFKGDEKKAALFFSGGKKVIKKGVDFQTAEKYQQKLKQVGAICQIEALNPGQNLTDPKIVSVFMTKTMTDIFLRTRPRKDHLQEVIGRRDLKYKDIENESPTSPNKPDARAKVNPRPWDSA